MLQITQLGLLFRLNHKAWSLGGHGEAVAELRCGPRSA